MVKCYKCGSQWNYNNTETRFHECFQCGNNFHTDKLQGAVFVYMIECEDGSIYTGISNDVFKRLGEHKNGDGARYTKEHGVKRLLGFKKFNNRSLAMQEEVRIKRLSHFDKKQLVDYWKQVIKIYKNC